MLTVYVINRMHHITVRFCLCFEFGTNRLRGALTVLKRPVDHRSHIPYTGCLGAVKRVFFGYTFMHISRPNLNVSPNQST